MANTVSIDVTVYDRRTAAPEQARRTLVREAAFVIGVNGTDYTVMRTPGHDRDLAAGFLFTEGLIESVGDIAMLRECEDTPDAVTVRTLRADAATVSRTLVVSSSCGLCGRADIDALVARLGPVESDWTLNPAVLYEVPAAIRTQQTLFETTGATHAAALFDEHGALRIVREDVGRHNAVDKVVGHALLTGLATHRMGLFLSGRTSLELIVKAARARIPIVASVSAPTDAAVAVADRLGITVTGFARGSAFTVYTHPERLQPHPLHPSPPVA